MATLNSTATGGLTSYSKYIENNKNWPNLNLIIEHNLHNIPVFDAKGNILQLLNQKEEIGQLINPDLHKIEGIVKNVKWKDKHFLQTKKGFISIFNIRKPTGARSTTADEDEAREALDTAIANIGYPVNIRIRGKTKKFEFKNVIGTANIKGTPKADFAIVDTKDKKVGFISHKASGGAGAFQQYSGISKKANLTFKEIDIFAQKVYKYTGSSAKSGQSFFMWLKNMDLINMSVFGPDFGKASFNEENCHFIAQGHPKLIKINDDYYELKWTDHLLMNGEGNLLKDLYKPILAAKFTTGRRFESGKLVINNLRAGIYPYGFIKGRRAIEL